jgi:hypothetical protein
MHSTNCIAQVPAHVKWQQRGRSSKITIIYKSIICEEEAYLLQLIRYTHNNPVKAKIVVRMNELDHYPYTGHAAIVGNMKCGFLRTDEVLGYF